MINTKHLTAIQKDNENLITHELKSQGFVISCILTHASSETRSLRSTAQQSMPKIFFKFLIKYLAASLQHVVSSCKSYLEDDRYTWRHNSVLLYLDKTFSSLSNCLLYADLPSVLFPSVITGDSLRPDLVLILNNSTRYILELTLGFESNMQINLTVSS